MPKITRSTRTTETKLKVDHLSYSSLALFATNPFMFRVRYMNGDSIDTAHGVSGVLGKAFHHAVDTFFKSEENDVQRGLEAGITYLHEYPEGFIKWTKTIPDRQSLLEKFAFCYSNRVKELTKTGVIETEMEIEETIDVEWRGERVSLPVKLKGYLDRVERDAEGRIVITDEKICYSFSNPEKIDGKKILQAVEYYFLVYAKFGEEPYKVRFTETKYTASKDGKQTQPYDVVFSENELFFDFYLRFYGDVVKALMGEQVFIPNLDALYDNEIAIIAYTHRLDEPEEKAKQQKLHRVDNITDILKKKVASVRNMKALESAVERSLVEYKNIDYSTMKTEEKIVTKLMEHGIVFHFDSMIDGNSFVQYRFTPSIGVKMGRLNGFSADIEQALGITGVRIVAPIPNTTFVGVEIPKESRRFVTLTDEIIGSRASGIPLGVDSSGEIVRLKLADMPHMLVAGATGSGKSVFLNATLQAILKQYPDVLLNLIDPKMVELSDFAAQADNIGYTPEEATEMFVAMYSEMNRRYKKMQGKKEKTSSDTPIVCVVDEFADLIMSSKDELQSLIVKLAQKGRAAGIHLILATQRPDSKVITGLLKANFPTKVAFATSSETNSRIILDESGAEKLMGKGDALIANPKFVGLKRVQAFNV